MTILELLSPDVIKVPLESTDRRGAIEELVRLLHAHGRIDDAEDAIRVVWEREQQRSTGIGEGLAIPHGKSSSIDSIRIALGRPDQPMDFESVDGKPVKLIILLLSPTDKTNEHIQALGKISKLMGNLTFRHAAYSASSAAEMYELFREAEQPASA